MEGSYSKVWRSRAQVPREEYRYFVEELMGTIRGEIASCEEKAYSSLPMRDAATLLFFESAGEVSKFAAEVRIVRGMRVACLLVRKELRLMRPSSARSAAGRSIRRRRRFISLLSNSSSKAMYPRPHRPTRPPHPLLLREARRSVSTRLVCRSSSTPRGL